jgi:hypothetical protein
MEDRAISLGAVVDAADWTRERDAA